VALTAALRRVARPAGNPAQQHVRTSIMTTLYVQDGTGYRQADSHAVIREAQTILARRFRVGAPALSSPERMREFLRLHIGPLEYEVFGAVFLDNRHRLIRHEDLFRGTIDCAQVHVREVVLSALRLSAAAVVLYHNHPSGNTEPSVADELITRRIQSALALLDVRVLDHLIVGATIFSFAEHGLL
jgi:DNA repair protein RadC